MATTLNMFMYSLTLVPPSNITQVIIGAFAGGGTKEQLLCYASGSRITIAEITRDGQLRNLLTHDVFAIVRKLAGTRLSGSPKEQIVITTDSGRLIVLEYMTVKQPEPKPDNRYFRQVHCETFGKSGIRRVMPGEYLVSDPKGRAIMVASVEKNKLVYILNRSEDASTISSPLEAHKHYALVYNMCAVDVEYDNPIFAALEVDYEETAQDPTGKAIDATEKQLVYYQLDLGLNHVVRKWSEPVERTANIMFQVPGGNDGPSGVLVCGEDTITYHHLGQEPLRLPIPRRLAATESRFRKRLITCGVMHKMRGDFFILVQTEDGDIFKVTMEWTPGKAKSADKLSIKYFDTIPVATNILILKTGYLFVACETGNHLIYQFEKLGDEDEEHVFCSDQYTQDPFVPLEPAFFNLREFENLNLVSQVRTNNPIMDCKVANLTDADAPQMYAITGAGARSAFKTMRHGIEISEIVSSDLPNMPTAVWTTKTSTQERFDAYIVLSFSNVTLVLTIGENVEEATDTGFLTSAPTLAVQALQDSMVQIHPRGIRQIRADAHVDEWPAPAHRTIVAATANERQVAVALSSGELIYFEMDPDGNLAEYEERPQMSGTVTCLSIGDVPPGRQGSMFLAVGCDDCTVRILSLDPESTLENKSIQGLTSTPTSLRIMSMDDSSSGSNTMHLHIGLQSGVYLRTLLDEVTGELTDTRSRFLGANPVQLFKVLVAGQPTILALASRAWLGYAHKETKTYMLTPLDYVPLVWGWNFSSEECPEGMVGIAGSTLRIFQVENIEENLVQEETPLMYTPRRMVKHPVLPMFYVGESDMNTLARWLRRGLIKEDRPEDAMDDEDVSDEMPPEQFGYPRAYPQPEQPPFWSSAVQIIDPLNPLRLPIETVEFERNEAVTAITTCPFLMQEGEHFLIVATAKDMSQLPRGDSGGLIHVYRISADGRSIKHMHETPTDHPIYALLPFQGRLLVGMNTTLQVFDLGVRQLLRKAQLKEVTEKNIVSLNTQGSRIVIGDKSDSIVYVVYKHSENRFIKFADDTVRRWTTCSTMVDYETTAGGDQFGNIWLVRAPGKASELADEDVAGAHLLHEKPFLNATAHRVELQTHYFVQDVPTSIQRTSFVPGGAEVLFWTGFQGTMGIMIPFSSKDDVEFFQKLESELRDENVEYPISGRDHLAYRSYYSPVKGVIDGDLCERFLLMKRELRETVAAELDTNVRDVERRVGEMRSRVAF